MRLVPSFRQQKTDTVLKNRRKILGTFLSRKISGSFFLDNVSNGHIETGVNDAQPAAPTKMRSATCFVGALAIFKSRREAGVPTKIQSAVYFVGAVAIFKAPWRGGAPTRMRSATCFVGA